jgi:hypothetical protein
MNQSDIIRMAREAGWTNYSLMVSVEVKRLERFAALVAAAEREACAKVCKMVWNSRAGLETGTALECATAIRARGEEPKRHPGYIMGEHWLQAAYTRICTGETEAEVMADYGWQRESR